MTIQNLRRLAFATSSCIPDIHPDDLQLVTELQQRGITATACIWNDPALDWSQFDAVLMRTTWDYFKHYDEFIAWFDRLDALPVSTINDSRLLRWNSDKRYLLELERQGVDIVPTQISNHAQLAGVLGSMRSQEVVVKPTISGAAWHTVRVRSGDAAFSATVEALPNSMHYMVQPFLPEIVSEGEWSLLYFDGIFSHAVIKRAASGDYRVQSDFGGTAQPAEPTPAMHLAGERILAAARVHGNEDCAYARVDGVMVGGKFLLMELEVIEPLLHLLSHQGAAATFADILSRRLDQADASPRSAFA